MLDAAKAAEAVITTGQVPSNAPVAEGLQDGEGIEGVELDGDDEVPASPATTVGTAGTVIDVNTLTPQTFLVRPTRPDANRNRGKNAFKRKPKPKPTNEAATGTVAMGTGEVMPIVAAGSAPVAASAPTALAGSTGTIAEKADEAEDDDVAEDELDESLVKEMEHLQLSLEEAWFLSEALGVLRIYEPGSVSCSCSRRNHAGCQEMLTIRTP